MKKPSRKYSAGFLARKKAQRIEPNPVTDWEGNTSRFIRRRKDFAVKTARALIQSGDLVALEDLKVRNMVRNHHLAKSISDVAWALFREWLEYFGKGAIYRLHART